MTKIWLLSDLHTETSSFDLPETPPGAEVLVIAGDVSEFHGAAVNMCQKWQRQCGLPVVFVPGNHDYYGSELNVFEDHREVWDVMAGHNLHVLHAGQSVIIAGCRFVGATLWTDFDVNSDVEAAMTWFDVYMPDHANIEIGDGLLYAQHLLPVHRRHLSAIEAALAVPFDGPSVVVTHHAPHPRSLRQPKFIDDSDASFASDLTSTIERSRPQLWIHGHVHSSHEYYVGDTRIVCNPRGYVIPTTRGQHLENRAFDPELVLYV